MGCYIGTHFYGSLGYADDLLLLSASRTGLQEMVRICERFALSKNLKFSTDPDPVKSKTKCIVFTKKFHDRQNIAPVLLNDLPLPWVGQSLPLASMGQGCGTCSLLSVIGCLRLGMWPSGMHWVYQLQATGT